MGRAARMCLWYRYHRHMRLLLVEDDLMIGEAVRTGLRKQAMAVDWVQDGMAAKSALSTETFDLVLLDLGLPKLDGLQLLKWLRGTGTRFRC